jgi:hypothetical protein
MLKKKQKQKKKTCYSEYQRILEIFNITSLPIFLNIRTKKLMFKAPNQYFDR